MQSAGRSQEIVEQYLKQQGIRRRELLRSPHFLSIPMVIASTDLIVTVPQPVGEIFGRIAELQVLPPPYPIPSFDVKQYWHRSRHADLGHRWQHPVRPGRHSGSARAALERRTIHIEDVRLDPDYSYGAKDVEDIRAILGVPILKTVRAPTSGLRRQTHARRRFT